MIEFATKIVLQSHSCRVKLRRTPSYTTSDEFQLPVSCLGIKIGKISLPGYFHSSLGPGQFENTQAKIKMPRQDYKATFDTKAGHRQ